MRENKKNIAEIKEFWRRAFEFSKNDFRKRYAGSFLGVIWAYIQPIMMVVIYWVAFQFGLKVGGVNGIPFLAWLISALIPWMLFSDIIMNSINCMSEYSYIVKKVIFNIDIIPVSKIMGCLYVHIVSIGIVILVAWIYGINTGVYLLQIGYYLFALLMLATPLAFYCSTVSVFFKDFSQLVTILLNILMWITPILWDISAAPENMRWLFKVNPMYYIISGFRDSVLFRISFLDDMRYGIYFWGVVVLLWFSCMRTYKKLQPHLADIL